MSQLGGTCDVCGRSRATNVCSSPFGAMSFAYCTECLQKPAEVLFVFEYLYNDVAGGDPSRLASEIRNWYTWIDGKYVHWDNFVWRKKNSKEKTPNG